MTPTSSEKQAALAWADSPPLGDGVDWQPRHVDEMKAILAASLRAAEAELVKVKADAGKFYSEAEPLLRKAESENAALRSHDRCGAGFRSRIKTLEEENARMRGALAAAVEWFVGPRPNNRTLGQVLEIITAALTKSKD